jgi:hypothetical protein
MIRTIAFISFGIAIALMPLSVLAQAPAVSGAATNHAKAHKPTGSYRSQMRHTRNTSKERARAGAEHVRTIRQQ